MDTKTPTTERTRTLMEFMERVESKLDQLQELQTVTEEVKEIKALMNKQESRWKALWRGLTQFMSLLKE